MSFPHPRPSNSFWTSREYELRNHRTTENLPEKTDVAIIGTGYAGAATAYFLLKQPEGRPSTVILEARETCSGATGRNGGHLKPDPYASVARWTQLHGPKIAAKLAEFESRQLWEVKAFVEEEKIDCDWEVTRAIDVYVDERTAKPALETFRRLEAAGFPFSRDLHVIDDPARAERISGVKGARLAFSFSAGSMWVLKLVSHLLRRCLEWGANLQTNTPALSISESRDKDGYYTVQTTRGSIKAKKIVVATNAYTAALLPEFKGKITSYRGVAARIANPDSRDKVPHLNNTYSIRYGPQEYDYLIPRSDGSIVVGGARQVLLKKDLLWRDNYDDSEIPPGTKEYFTNYMQRTFRGWEASGAKITHLWTGAMGYSEDLSPWIGELPDRPGVYVEAGFTAHGMPKIFGCAQAIAMLVRGDVQHISDKTARIPEPLWITRKRLGSNVKLAREYAAGDRPEGSARL